MDEIANKPKGWMNIFKAWWIAQQLTIIILFFFAVVLCMVYHFLSDGDFSFLMTLGSVLVLAGFGLLVAKLVVTRKLSNVSFKTLHAYALVFSARLCSILFYEGYLPFDRSGDWFYQTVEVSALVLTLGLIAATWVLRLKATGDKFDAKLMEKLGVPSDFGVLLLAVPALLFATLLHPSLNNNWLTDVAWTFALYLEAVAIWPQLYIFAKEDPVKEIEPMELNFVFLLAVARLLHFVFWVSSYQELNDKSPTARIDRKFPGYCVVAAQVINLAILSDFIILHLTYASRKSAYLPQHV